ncbi:mitotic-spindle organizing protein 2B isoform X1 [Anolis carolinensis]|uniref:mitotic-spindle organizing protein 2B isoform X1 n=1 Tax=Anolis carolinensis TaxID=28377 RepID=UPI00046267BF|nr:PREDICTED: mitotic-spindle organizing protein 2B isoform X1 [Anolis carolinensis]|eukprot:XP_008121175.1 PREDICTED: mitotic-spindle organizing protein 2B isoform X1 [Anolis carolinensis]
MSSGMEAKGSGGSRARRKLLTAEEAELFELAQAAGTGLDPEVFKILLDLLRMNVAPVAIYQVLRAMCAAGQRVSGPEANATEPPREPPIVSAKTSKIPAPLSFSSVLRPPRIGVTKAVVYSPAAVCSPLSQGPPGSFQFSCCLFSPFAGRPRTISATSGNQTLSDQSSREGSIQRVPRQPSASRLQKAGCPGKSA